MIRISATALLFATLFTAVIHAGLKAAEPKFVAVGYGLRRLISDDGMVWRDEQCDPDPEHAQLKDFLLRGVAYGQGTMVAVGGSSTSRILISADGKTWTDHSVPQNFLGDVAFGNNLFVAVGYHRALTSKDGRQWSPPIPLREASWRRIIFGNSRFVAIGNAATQDPESGCIATSTAGENWTTTLVAGKAVPQDIAFGNGVFVVVGSNGLRATSSDGIAWEQRVLGTAAETLSTVLWTGGKFLASGNQGGYQSSDGRTWTAADIRFPSRVAFGHNVFVGCSAGKLSYSSDGKTWVPAKAEGKLQITKILSLEPRDP